MPRFVEAILDTELMLLQSDGMAFTSPHIQSFYTSIEMDAGKNCRVFCT